MLVMMYGWVNIRIYFPSYRSSIDKKFYLRLGNARGTEPSREHLYLSPNGPHQKEYWSFSWHQIGIYDLPASIDYILNATKFEKLNYVGFSQGTTSFFVLTSIRPEYNNKIVEANLVAPVALLKGNNNQLYNTIAHFYKPLKKVFEIFHIYKLTVNNKLLLKIAETACKNTVHSTPFACKLVLSVLDSSQINCVSFSDILNRFLFCQWFSLIIRSIKTLNLREFTN